MNPNKIWFYFRHGYAYYIASVLSPINTILLLVGFSDKIGIDTDTLPLLIGVIAVAGVPLVAFIGRTHYKKAYKSEADVLAKNNPYNFQLVPGHQKEVMFPVLLEMVRYFQILNTSNSDRNERLNKLEEKLLLLLDGKSLNNNHK